jgi:hypothetical protein
VKHLTLALLLPLAAGAYTPSGSYTDQSCDGTITFTVQGSCHIGEACPVTWKSGLPGTNVVSLNLYEQSDGYDPIAPVGAQALPPEGDQGGYNTLRMKAHLANASWGDNTFFETDAGQEKSYYHGVARWATVPQKQKGSVDLVFDRTATGWDHLSIVYDCWIDTSAWRTQVIFPIRVLP